MCVVLSMIMSNNIHMENEEKHNGNRFDVDQNDDETNVSKLTCRKNDFNVEIAVLFRNRRDKHVRVHRLSIDDMRARQVKASHSTMNKEITFGRSQMRRYVLEPGRDVLPIAQCSLFDCQSDENELFHRNVRITLK
jgi:hypothetical protein